MNFNSDTFLETFRQDCCDIIASVVNNQIRLQLHIYNAHLRKHNLLS